MGFQAGQAWIYRASGLYRTADNTSNMGVAYGSSYRDGANVTAIQHNASTLEFLLDGKSQGLIQLPTPMPDDVVGCVGVCFGGIVAMEPVQPAPQSMGTIEAQTCASAQPEDLLWTFDGPNLALRHKATGGYA